MFTPSTTYGIEKGKIYTIPCLTNLIWQRGENFDFVRWIFYVCRGVEMLSDDCMGRSGMFNFNKPTMQNRTGTNL